MRRCFFLPPEKHSFYMDKHAGFMKALKCRECGREYPLAATHVCEFDFGPLEVVYDYDRIKKSLGRATIARSEERRVGKECRSHVLQSHADIKLEQSK